MCKKEDCANCKEKSDLNLAEFKQTKWWFEHSKKQLTTLWETLSNELDSSSQSSVLEKMGRNCSQSLGWAQKYIGNPEGFFEFMREHAGETIEFDKSADKITITTKERDCDCRMIDSSTMPAVYCNCSKGWQMQTYETILKKKVDVKVKESVLMGSKRCVFEITVQED